MLDGQGRKQKFASLEERNQRQHLWQPCGDKLHPQPQSLGLALEPLLGRFQTHFQIKLEASQLRLCRTQVLKSLQQITLPFPAGGQPSGSFYANCPTVLTKFVNYRAKTHSTAT